MPFPDQNWHVKAASEVFNRRSIGYVIDFNPIGFRWLNPFDSTVNRLNPRLHAAQRLDHKLKRPGVAHGGEERGPRGTDGVEAALQRGEDFFIFPERGGVVEACLGGEDLALAVFGHHLGEARRLARPGGELEEVLLLGLVEGGIERGEFAHDLRHILQVAVGAGEVDVEGFFQLVADFRVAEAGEHELEGVADFRAGAATGTDDRADDPLQVAEREAGGFGHAGNPRDPLEQVIDGDVVVVGDRVEAVEHTCKIADVEAIGGVDPGEFFGGLGGGDLGDVGGHQRDAGGFEHLHAGEPEARPADRGIHRLVSRAALGDGKGKGVGLEFLRLLSGAVEDRAEGGELAVHLGGPGDPGPEGLGDGGDRAHRDHPRGEGGGILEQAAGVEIQRMAGLGGGGGEPLDVAGGGGGGSPHLAAGGVGSVAVTGGAGAGLDAGVSPGHAAVDGDPVEVGLTTDRPLLCNGLGGGAGIALGIVDGGDLLVAVSLDVLHLLLEGGAAVVGGFGVGGLLIGRSLGGGGELGGGVRLDLPHPGFSGRLLGLEFGGFRLGGVVVVPGCGGGLLDPTEALGGVLMDLLAGGEHPVEFRLAGGAVGQRLGGGFLGEVGGERGLGGVIVETQRAAEVAVLVALGGGIGDALGFGGGGGVELVLLVDGGLCRLGALAVHAGALDIHLVHLVVLDSGGTGSAVGEVETTLALLGQIHCAEGITAFLEDLFAVGIDLVEGLLAGVFIIDRTGACFLDFVLLEQSLGTAVFRLAGLGVGAGVALEGFLFGGGAETSIHPGDPLLDAGESVLGLGVNRAMLQAFFTNRFQ